MTPDIFLQLFHLHCVILFISVLMSPSICRVLPVYLNSVTCGSWADCILTLHNGVPFRYMCSIFALDTFIPLFSKASLHCSSSNSSTHFSLAHSSTSSANITCQGASFLMFSVSESFRMANMKGLKADPWWRPTPTANGSLVPAAHLTTVSHWWYMSLINLMYLSGTPLSRIPQYSSFLGTMSYAFSRSMNTQSKSCCPSLYLSCSCLSAKIASFVDFPFTNRNCSSLMLIMFLSQFSCTISCSVML